jgi:hypothetical protein
MSIPRLVAQSDAVFRAEVGADAWFLIVTLLAGAIAAVVVCWLFGEVGPGAALGLGVGGICASLVADRVGFLAERASTTTALQAFGLHPGGSVLAEIDFRVRAVGVLTAWPLSSMLVLGLAVAFDAWRR